MCSVVWVIPLDGWVHCLGVGLKDGVHSEGVGLNGGGP